MSIQGCFSQFYKNIKITREDKDYSNAREKDDSILGEIKEAFNSNGYPVIDNFLQGSFSTHTAIRNKDGDFDIDRAIVIDADKAPSNPLTPKKIILDVLEKRGFKNAKIKKPCVTADYSSINLHIDIPLYKLSFGQYYLA
ncbi:MAG: nucleotidyltransferase domain-containing protein, partial [Shewanella sp.]